MTSIMMLQQSSPTNIHLDTSLIPHCRAQRTFRWALSIAGFPTTECIHSFTRSWDTICPGIGLDLTQLLEQSYRRHVTHMLPTSWWVVNFTIEHHGDARGVLISCMIPQS
jgi:hypothetical protein